MGESWCGETLLGMLLSFLCAHMLSVLHKHEVKYKRDFEESKGRGFSIVTDTPELQRLKRTQEQISNLISAGDSMVPGLEWACSEAKIQYVKEKR
ncbi:LIM and SH3 domain protein 1 [Tupaia chinensis]|uniref:LIM and SH3 domain protein 1 n=1 Tax=Tupaia chinensis TaxID=246437 RepID=L9L956_TUPCH|nr:LIM and SH3 domain protein 1 [Tupaia chinensis]